VAAYHFVLTLRWPHPARDGPDVVVTHTGTLDASCDATASSLFDRAWTDTVALARAEADLHDQAGATAAAHPDVLCWSLHAEDLPVLLAWKRGRPAETDPGPQGAGLATRVLRPLRPGRPARGQTTRRAMGVHQVRHRQQTHRTGNPAA
jgi:hypothetical protein